MLKALKDQSKLFLFKLPLAEKYWLSKRFETELALINGVHTTTSAHPSILHFSVNKSATQYVKSIINQCSATTGLVNVGIHDYAFKSNFPYLNKLSAAEMQDYQHIFKPQGYTYSVFGGMIDGIHNLDQYLVVLMVRDPRDVLVSGYYSVAFSHSEPAQGTDKHDEFLENRAFALNATVDEYAIAQCNAVFEVYNRYNNLLLQQHPNPYITKYEDMVTDFESWLRNLADYCQFNLTDALFKELVATNEKLRPSAENAKKHIRKGKAGDYKEKLKPETIDYIEAKLAPLLGKFGYA